MDYLADHLVVKRWLYAGLALVLIIFLGLGLQHSRVETTYRAVLNEGDPYKAEVDEAQKDFPPGTSVLFVFQHTDGVFQRHVLEAVDALTLRYGEIRGAVAVGSLMNRRLTDTQADQYDRDYLVPDLGSVSDAELADIRDLALEDDDLTKSILAPTGDMTIASIKYRAEPDEQAVRLEIAASVHALRDELRDAHPDVEIYVLGNAIFESDGYAAQQRDRVVLFPLVIFASIGLLWFCLRSLSYGICLMAVAFVAVSITTGTYGWLDIPFNQISTLGPLVVLVIGVADGIHIASNYAQALHRGLDKLAAMKESLAINIQPVTLATITTAMGFLSLNYSTSPGIYGFGNVVAIGVVWAFVLTLALLPALLLLLPTKKVPQPLGIAAFIRQVTELVLRHAKPLLAGGSILIVVTLALLPLNKLDFNRFNFVDQDSDLYKVLQALREKIGNDQSLVYSINSGAYYGITEPEFLAQVDTFSQWLEEQPDVSFVASYTDFLKGQNKSEHDDDPAWEVVPTDQLQVIDYLVGYQLVQEIEPNLESIFNSDYSAIRMIVGTSNLSNGELIALNDRIDGWIAENLSDRFRVLHGDNSILFARLDQAIAVELMQGFTLSFVLITLTMMIGLRSIRYGLLSIMPNLFPATIVFGFWGLFVGELSPYVLMLFSISIGLVVDDSVHVLSKYIGSVRQGLSSADAVRYSLDKAGSAITVTTLSIAIGTGFLVFSSTMHFQNLALLLTPIVVVALLLDLLFLPPLLMAFDRKRLAGNILLQGGEAIGVRN